RSKKARQKESERFHVFMAQFAVFCYTGYRKTTIRVYLKTHDVTGSEGFLRCARHFFAGILTYFKEK
ncbi:MAG: hypothetical protein U0O42_06930, partial [Oscillospiraceae bacterium]